MITSYDARAACHVIRPIIQHLPATFQSCVNGVAACCISSTHGHLCAADDAVQKKQHGGLCRPDRTVTATETMEVVITSCRIRTSEESSRQDFPDRILRSFRNQERRCAACSYLKKHLAFCRQSERCYNNDYDCIGGRQVVSNRLLRWLSRLRSDDVRRLLRLPHSIVQGRRSSHGQKIRLSPANSTIFIDRTRPLRQPTSALL